MIHKLYVIYDRVAEQVGTPIMMATNDKFLLRDLETKQIPDVMAKHPEDFDVMYIGDLDTEKCKIFALENAKLVSHLGTIREAEKGLSENVTGEIH